MSSDGRKISNESSSLPFPSTEGYAAGCIPETFSMDAKLQCRIQRYGWDRAADHYEQAWKNHLEPAQTRMLALAAIRRGDHVLDIACGTGLVTFRAAEITGPTGRVVGLDISGEMIRRARRRAAEINLANVSFERSGAEVLPLENNSFDVALSALGLMYMPDPALAVAEMHRVLKDGATAAAAVWGRRERCGWADIFPIVDARVKTEVCPLFFQLGTGDSLGKTFERAGFEQVAIERIDTILGYDSADDALVAVFAGGPVALAYSRFDEATRKEAHAEYLESISGFRDADGRYAIPGEFVAVCGKKKTLRD
jgi:ubiquinone/menaquinone biosynthesis C-methylase UbiE